PPAPPAPAEGSIGGSAAAADEEDEEDVAAPERGRLVAPSEVPTTIPAPAPGVPAGVPGGVRGGVPVGTGRAAPTRGLVPSYSDPRLWVAVHSVPAATRTTAAA